jgi:hypothetical protein
MNTLTYSMSQLSEVAMQDLLNYVLTNEFQTWAIDAYVRAMRGSMFTGFLTLSGFLLTATTFVVIQMKRELYDQPFYLERCRKQRRFGKGEPVYAPLRRLSRVLIVAICLSLLASASQLTIGLRETFTAVVFCYAIAIFALVGVAWVLFLMSQNLKAWFDDLDGISERLLSQPPSQDSTED